jgi:hypothetical protein
VKQVNACYSGIKKGGYYPPSASPLEETIQYRVQIRRT